MYPIGSTCRVCLFKGDNLVSIFENDEKTTSLNKKITMCLNTEIVRDNMLPSKICGSCVMELDISYNFIQKCLESEKLLKEHLQFAEEAIKEEIDTDFGDNEWEHDNREFIESDIEEFLNIHSKKKRKKRKKRLKVETVSLQCPICKFVGVSQSAMIIHSRKHTGEKPFTCEKCGRAFSQKGSLKNHLANVHTKGKDRDIDGGFECDACSKVFKRKRNLKIHSRVHTGERPYSCPHCPMSFTQVGPLIRHRRIHSGEKPFSCEKCGKLFADRTMVKMHQIVHSDARNYSCDICGKAVKSKNNLVKHIQLHYNAKPCVCHECGARCSTKGNLKSHIKKLHSAKSGICPVCQKFCSDIIVHTRKHTREAIFECSICFRRFIQQSRLTVHMNKHKNADKFKCEMDDCKSAFPMKCMLEFHILKFHKHVTPYVCSVCDRGFYRNSDLIKHVKVHHSNKH